MHKRNTEDEVFDRQLKGREEKETKNKVEDVEGQYIRVILAAVPPLV